MNEPPKPAEEFAALLDEVIVDFERKVDDHRQKLIKLKEAIRDR